MSFSISRKLFTIIAMAVVVMVGLTIANVSKLRVSTFEDRRAEVRHHVESAVSILADYQKRVAAGELTLSQAQSEAKAVIGAIRYGDNDYFFVVDKERTGVVHPNPDIIGRDLTDVKDQNDVFLFQGLVSQAIAGGGFTDYVWPRAGSDIPIEKVSYSEEFAPWGWVVATGVYVDDISAKMREAIIQSLLWDGLALIALVGGGLFVARSITRPVESIRESISLLNGGDYAREVKVESSDEIGEIAVSLEGLRSTLSAKSGVEADAQEKADQMAQVVRTLAAHLSALSDGNLDIDINDNFAPEFEGLRHDFNQAMATLRDVTYEIDNVAQTVSLKSAEITGTTDMLAREAETNAATLDTAAFALEDVSSHINETAQVAGKTDEDVVSARTEAEGGKILIERTSEAMDKIKTSSSEIANVTKVIEDIAFQTNLLALNAGVEAARAGEAGLGFMIVAQEVRNLAGRCTEAVVSINELIGEANKQVESGASEFVQTRGTLESIIASFENIQERVSTINTSTQNQATQVATVSSSVNELRALTQRNAASLEESSAASHHLQSDAQKLTQELAKLSTSGPNTNTQRAA